MSTVMNANRRLATALGWTNITEAGGALLGMPPWGVPSARGQAAVPNWAGDWRECGPLMARYKMCVVTTDLDAVATCRSLELCGPGIESFAGHIAEDSAIRLAIVQAVCAKLEAGQ